MLLTFGQKNALVQVPDYTLHRSRRRTIAIHVHDGRVEVLAPLRAARRDIDIFVCSKAHWIEKKLADLRERRIEQLCIEDGSRLVVMGQALTLRWQSAGRGDVLLDGERLWIRGRALDAEAAEVGRVLRVAPDAGDVPGFVFDDHTAADAAVTTGGFGFGHARS